MMESPRSELPQESRSATEVSGSKTAPSRDWGDVVSAYNSMLSKIKSWGQALLLLGVVQMIASGVLSAAWGVLLLLVGVASFYFKDAAMFMVYAMTILWAGIGNLFGGGWIWVGYGVLQFYWAFGLLREFLRFRHVQAEYATHVQSDPSKGAAPPMRARRIFPWASLILGVLVLAGLVVVFVLVALSSDVQPSNPLYILFDILPDLAVVGMAMGLASFLSRFPSKLVAAIGMVACSLVMLGWLALLLI
jgi:hypothetical protein